MRASEVFPQRLQELLRQHDMTQEELSCRTGIPLATIRAYLGGKRPTISTRNLLLFAQILDLPMSDLVDYLFGVGNLYK